MSRRTIRPLLALIATAMLVSLVLASSAFATGEPGSTAPLAVQLNQYVNSTYVASLGNPAGIDFWLKVELWPGQIFSADFTHGVEVQNVKPVLYPISKAFDYVGWKPTSDTLTHMSFVAPVHGMYQVLITTSGTTTQTVNTITVAPRIASKASFSWVSAPGSVKHGKTFSLLTKAAPGYFPLDKPVIKYYVDRKSGKFKAYKSYAAKVLSSTDTLTQYSASLKLAKKGTYRVRLKLTDAAHPKGVYTAYKTIKIK